MTSRFARLKKMTHLKLKILLTLAAVVAVAHGLPQAQAPAGNRHGYSAPRTPWGDPDLQGTYTNSDESGTPLARPAEFAGRKPEEISPAEMARLAKERAGRIEKTAETIGGTEDNNTGAGPSHWYENYNPKNSRPWMVLDAPDYQVPPITADAKERATALRAARGGGDGYYVGPFRGPEEFTPYVRCISRGVPGSMMPAIYGNSYEIVQGPGYVAISYEMIHETRVVPIDSRPPLPSHLRQYLGDARGHWEGDTLVIRTANFNGRTSYRGSSDKLVLTERFRRVDAETLRYEMTVEDPGTWERPWTAALNLKPQTDQMYEYACHEGNNAMRNMLSAARAQEKNLR